MMGPLTVALALVLTLLTPQPALSQGRISTFEEAKKFYEAGVFDKAIGRLKEFLAKRPAHLEARLLLARSYKASGRVKDAIRELQAALKVAPKKRELAVVMELARLLKEDQKYAESARFYARALKGRPQLLKDVGLDYAQSLSWSGDTKGAAEVYGRLALLFPKRRDIRLALARNLAWSGENDRAAQEYKRLLAQGPEEVSLLKELGRAQLLSGDLEGSAQTLARALELDPRDNSVRLDLARALSGLKRYPEAISHLKSLKEAEPENIEVRKTLAEVLSSDHQFESAVLEYREILKRRPEDIDIALAIARNLNWAGRYAESAQEYERVIPKRADKEVLTEYALMLYLSGQLERAAAEYTRLVEAYPDEREIRLNLARVLTAKKDYPKAIQHYIRLKEQDPKELTARRELAEALSANKDFDGAIKEFREILDIRPDLREVRLLLARNLTWAGRYAEAVEEYKTLLSETEEGRRLLKELKLMRLNPSGEEIPELLLLKEMGRAQLLSGDFEGAARTLSKALELDPEDHPLRLDLALALSSAGRFLEAAQEYRFLLKARPGDRDLILSLARNLAYGGRPKEGISVIEDLLRALPEDTEARLERARFLSWSGQYRPAEAEFKRLIGLRPKDPEVHIGLGGVYLITGRARGALREVEEALRLDPTHKEALRLRGEIREGLRPTLLLPFRHREDNDGNRSNLYGIGGGIFLEPQTRLDLVFNRIDARSRGIMAHLSRFLGLVESRPSDPLAVTANLALALIERRGGDALHLLPGLSFKLLPLNGLQMVGGFQRDVLDATGLIIQNDIRTSTLSGNISLSPLTTLSLSGGYEYADYSDGNVKRRALGSIRTLIIRPNPRLSIGYAFEFLSFARDLDKGYFDPSGYIAHTGQMEVSGELFEGRFFFDLFAFLGEARTQGQVGVVPDFDTIWGLTGLIRLKISRRLTATGSFEHFRSATATRFFPGFRESIFGLRLTYRL